MEPTRSTCQNPLGVATNCRAELDLRKTCLPLGGGLLFPIIPAQALGKDSKPAIQMGKSQRDHSELSTQDACHHARWPQLPGDMVRVPQQKHTGLGRLRWADKLHGASTTLTGRKSTEVARTTSPTCTCCRGNPSAGGGGAGGPWKGRTSLRDRQFCFPAEDHGGRGEKPYSHHTQSLIGPPWGGLQEVELQP